MRVIKRNYDILMFIKKLLESEYRVDIDVKYHAPIESYCIRVTYFIDDSFDIIIHKSSDMFNSIDRTLEYIEEKITSCWDNNLRR